MRLSGAVFEIVARIAVHYSLELLPLLKKMPGLVVEVVDFFWSIVAR